MGGNRYYSQSQGGHSETPKTITAIVLTLHVLQKCKLKKLFMFPSWLLLSDLYEDVGNS
jgi:hypothetical protein